MEKGTIQSHPEMGVGIRSRYRFADTNKMSMLKYDIKNQIESYLPPSYGNVDVNCQIINKVIVINIVANEMLFRFTYDQTTDIFKLSEI